MVDASILESCFAMLESVAPEFAALGAVRGPTGTTVVNNAPSNLYRSRDERWVVIAANSDSLFPRLCAAMGREDLAEDPRFATHDARGHNMEALDQAIGAWAAGLEAAEIEAALVDAGVVCAPVNTIAEVFEDPHVRAREMLVPVEDPELGEVVGPAVFRRLSRPPGRRTFTSSWEAGADNEAVFGELLGLDAEALEDLRRQGVV